MSAGMAASPKTVVLDGHRLLEIRQQLHGGGNNDFQTTLQLLKTEADGWLSKGPWSVIEKKKAPPSGDLQDYTSQAPYWWPSPSADGKPYVQLDGKKNPEVLTYTDRVYVGKVFRSSWVLVLSWFYGGGETYARHAGNIIRTWFIDPKTRMNPNLNHAQLIPFANTGRHIGIIDFSQAYTTVLDAVTLLQEGNPSGGLAPGWTTDDANGFQDWNREFLQWLTESDFGKAERRERNNHGTFASMMIAAIALFVGDEELAKKEVASVQAHINGGIKRDGSQPAELERTRSWHYSTFNLLAFTRLAFISQKVGIDLWNYEGPEGQSILKAIEYIIPAATDSTPWKFDERQFERYAAADIIRAAADAGHEASKAALDKIETPPSGDLWPLRPAPEQLEPVQVDKKDGNVPETGLSRNL